MKLAELKRFAIKLKNFPGSNSLLPNLVATDKYVAASCGIKYYDKSRIGALRDWDTRFDDDFLSTVFCLPLLSFNDKPELLDLDVLRMLPRMRLPSFSVKFTTMQTPLPELSFSSYSVLPLKDNTMTTGWPLDILYINLLSILVAADVVCDLIPTAIRPQPLLQIILERRLNG